MAALNGRFTGSVWYRLQTTEKVVLRSRRYARGESYIRSRVLGVADVVGMDTSLPTERFRSG